MKNEKVKSDASMLLANMSDEYIEGLAKGSEGDAGIEQDRQIACLYIDTANVLRAYIRLRKENAKLKDELKDAKATCSEDKCPFALDGLCDENKRLRNLLDSIKERVEKTDTDFDSMYYLEMMTEEDFETIDGLYETVKAIKEMFSKSWK